MKVLTLFLLIAAAAGAAESPPNIVLIHADDLGFAELGSYGQQKIRTPNLDRLAAGGERWTNYYSGSPVCSPSRNVLLSGRHGGGCDVQDLKRVNPREGSRDGELSGDWPVTREAWLLPQALKKAGYATGVFGKWGLGEFGTSGAPDQHGVDTFYGYTDQRVCHSFYPEFLWRDGRKETINTPSIPGHQKAPEGPVDDAKYTGQQHASKLIIAEALKYVDARAADHKPFFLYYAPLEPHVALQPPKEWVDRYPADWDKEPYRGDKDYLPHSRPRAAYAATISFLDHNVGLLLDRLKAAGLENNTLVVFTSDNGTTHDVGGVDHAFFNSVSDLRGLKGQMYEGGIRVPFIASWPGRIPAGKVIDQPGYHADIMPTLCALTGSEAGRPYGDNLLPVLTGETAALATRRPMVWCTGGYTGQAAVRIGDMKAIRRNLYTNPTPWEVYNLAADRAETKDLAASRADVVTAAEDVLRREYQPAPEFRKLNLFASSADPAPARGMDVFRRLDTDKDAKLSFAEWQLSPKAKANPQRLKPVFDGLDTDQDGSLSPAEFTAQFRN